MTLQVILSPFLLDCNLKNQNEEHKRFLWISFIDREADDGVPFPNDGNDVMMIGIFKTLSYYGWYVYQIWSGFSSY